MILDQKAEAVEDRLWLVSNRDGTREVVGDGERNGRGGFAPPWGLTYREIINDMARSLQSDCVSWLQFYSAYVAGRKMTEGPLGGAAMPAISFVSNAHTYTAYLGTKHEGRFLGFGGRVAKITMADGTEYESNNVWSGRDVPPNLREILRDNAVMKWGS